MTKLAVARITAIILLLLNISLIAFIVFRKPPHPQGPRNLIIEKLNFDKNQIASYDLLIKNHQEKIQAEDKQIVGLKNSLYSTLDENIPTEYRDSLVSELTRAQAKIEQIHYEHFLDIRKLCKPEQEPLYRELTRDLADYFSPKDKRRR